MSPTTLRLAVLALSLLVALIACHSSPRPNPASPRGPVAATRPHDVVSPHGTRNDPYYWLRDDTRKNPEVLAYLEAENEYARAALAPMAATQKQIFDEIVGRLKQDDASVPVLNRGYWYYSRFETGKQYPVHARRKGTMEAPEEVMLDGNAMAAGHDYFNVGGLAVSPDNRYLAYGLDTVGRGQYVLQIKDLTTGALLPDTAQNIAPRIAWANDNKTVFYVGKDSTTLRERYVYRHVLGGTGPDALAHDETDGAYYVSLGKTKSRKYVQISMWSTVATEIRLIDAEQPTTAPRVFVPRQKDHEYSVDHLGGHFVINTNWEAKNFRLMTVADGKESDRGAWKALVPYQPEVLTESFALYDSFVAVTERRAGQRQVRIVKGDGNSTMVPVEPGAYSASTVDTPEPATTKLRYVYGSLTTPATTYEVDVNTLERVTLKVTPVPNYDASLYASERIAATAPDGTQVPISVVYKKTTARDGTAPLLVHGYGAYGIVNDPNFSTPVVSLLDRGWIYAIAHVRGGEDLGRAWYEDGKLMKKMNTFTDFIAVGEHLVSAKYAAKDKLFAVGGSAGGLLMGAVLNLRPDLFRGAVAKVPFVDVVTTMLDESIPLTTNEFDEWGNPKNKDAYDYLMTYSPYDNVKAVGYPALFVTTGLWDSQVQYFEPAKWVAKLRATKTDENMLLMDVNMDAGHGGASGRFDRYQETARDWAFLLLALETPDRRAR